MADLAQVQTAAAAPRRRIWGLHPNVFFVGLVSLLTDVSSEMIFTLIPVFLSNVLGAGATLIGFVAGLTESTDAVFKIVSGRLSDRIGKRKLLTGLGYGLSTVMKPLMYVASSWLMVLAIRFSDRIGKGVRGAPRDALIADSLQPEQRGRGFGLHRAMDTFGAMLGLVLAAVIIYSVQGGGLKLGVETYRWLVVAGAIPGVLAVLVLVLFVRDTGRKAQATNTATTAATRRTPLGARFTLFLIVVALFTLGNSSEFFVILRGQDLGAPLFHITLMLVLFNTVYTAVSVPAGMLSDKLGRTTVIALGWFVYAASYLGFALASDMWQVWGLFAVYGIYRGLTEGVARALVADLVPADRRGTAYGLYHGVVGGALFPASVIGGWLWSTYSPAATFYFGSGLAFLAVVGIVLLMGMRRERTA